MTSFKLIKAHHLNLHSNVIVLNLNVKLNIVRASQMVHFVGLSVDALIVKTS